MAPPTSRSKRTSPRPPRSPPAGTGTRASCEREQDRIFARRPGSSSATASRCAARRLLHVHRRRRAARHHARRRRRLHAFSNVCRHRAGPVARGRGPPQVADVRLPRLDLQSRRQAAGRRPSGTGSVLREATSRACPPVRVETWGPFLFVCLDPAAPPLPEVLGAIPAETSHLPLTHMTPLQEGRLRGRVQLEGLRRQLPRGVPHPDRAPRALQEIDYRAYSVETAAFHSKQHAPIRSKSEESLYRREPARRARARGALLLGVPEHDAQPLPGQPADEHHPAARAPRRTLTRFEWYVLEPEQPRRRRGVRAVLRVLRSGPAGGHRDLRGRPEGPAFAHVRPTGVTRCARERRPPFPRAADARAEVGLRARTPSFRRSSSGTRPSGPACWGCRDSSCRRRSRP